MKTSTIIKRRGNRIAILVSLIFVLSLTCLVSCTTTVEPPQSVDKVYSVNLQYDNKNVDGQLSVDLSMKTVKLVAKVLQDGGELVAYKSSDESVATISQNGIVSLLSVGETAITATVGDKTHSIILIVKNDNSAAAPYTVTISGGVAKNANGEVVTSAKAGEYLTLVPSMPAHKDFVKWDYGVEDLWINGNVIKMPAGDLVVSAEYTDTMYTLRLVGAKALKANLTENPDGTSVGGSNLEDFETVYKFPYGTEITIQANDPGDSRLFVGWDQNYENNRVGGEGLTSYTFNMFDEETTLTAVFSNVIHNVLPGANTDSSGESTSIYTGSGLSGVTAKKITAGVIEGAYVSDPDLESLYGYSFSIPCGMLGISSSPENIAKSDLNTRNDLEPKTIRIIFKNRGDYPVTVELGYSYFGNYGSTGVVTVPAGAVVTRVFNSNIGLNDCSWSFAVRDTVAGTAGETVELDVVAAAAQTYPNGYPLLNSSDDAQYMTFSAALTLKTGWKNGGSRGVFNDKGAQIFVSRASNMNADKASAYAKITNLPEYDPENPTTTVYIQVLNLVNNIDDPKNNFTIMFSSSNDAFDTTVTPLASAVVDIQEAGQIILLKLEIPRAENEGDIYMHFVKTTKEAGQEYNVFVQFAYNNIFGYEEE